MKGSPRGGWWWLAVVSATLYAAACGTASDNPADTAASIEPAAPAHTLWAMETGGATTYLMGSVHALRSADYPLPEALMSAYADSATLVMELALNDLDLVSMAATTQALGMLPPGDSLQNWLSPRDRAEAMRKSTDIGLDLRQFDGLEPWLAALTILNVQMADAGYRSAAGIEAHFAALAQQQGKVVLGLETLEEQLGVFDGLSRDEQARLLLNTLDDASDLENGLDTLVDAWKRGDTATLNIELQDGFKGLPGMYEALVVNRNRAWLDTITALDPANGNYLIIVGAMHLVGDDSVIAMLKDRGYQVRQL